MNEIRWKADLRRNAEATGLESLSLHGHAMQARGWPDLYFAGNAFCGWIELKSPTAKVDTIQRIIGRRLARYGQYALVRAHENWSGYRISTADESVGVDFHGISISDARELLVRVANFVSTHS